MIKLCKFSKSVVPDCTASITTPVMPHWGTNEYPNLDNWALFVRVRTCGPRVHPPLTRHSISPTKLPCKARMATERAVENNQIFLNPCVLVDRLHQSFPLCGDVAQELSMNSAQIPESHGRLPEQRIEVAGSCLNPNSLMPR